ncbi:hypothetical protein SAMN05421507_11452 [Lentzea jiangxiensis]|uniref:Uncharacterized protein n=1 Tax=Lentzea jiangxiensis TaxID=641025 RepID=A0A1H0VE07_9PSEU|nr:hypothetical protein SAMN05421507_11452 [Lentzea jiangxiensis]
MAVPSKPSTEGAALDDRWTRHCVDRASRRALMWTVLAGSAFVLQFLLVLVWSWSSPVALVLLFFAAAVLWGVTRRRPVRLPEGEPWHFAHVQWEGGRLVVQSSPPLLLTLSVDPLVRGRIARHRRAWFVPPDAAGNTVVTFRGVPRLIPARVTR